jgi:hypothetical protein
MALDGPHRSSGLPELKLWKQVVTVEERDITVDDPLEVARALIGIPRMNATGFTPVPAKPTVVFHEDPLASL